MFSFTFYNKFVEILKLFPTKTAKKRKKAKKIPNFLEKFAFYGPDMELEPEPEVGTGTITFSKFGTGTITFQKSEPEP
jgi:hypothetical protein